MTAEAKPEVPETSPTGVARAASAAAKLTLEPRPLLTSQIESSEGFVCLSRPVLSTRVGAARRASS